jgi:hypothetical protein
MLMDQPVWLGLIPHAGLYRHSAFCDLHSEFEMVGAAADAPVENSDVCFCDTGFTDRQTNCLPD